MGEGFQFFEILLFAAIAVFIILRLRSVLGRRTGSERPSAKSFLDRTTSNRDDNNVVSLPDRGADDAQEDLPPAERDDVDGDPAAGDPAAEEPAAEEPAAEEPEDDLAVGIAEIRASDESFDPEGFVQGARTAYDMVLTSFATGDTDTLRALLDDDVYDDFRRAISDRDSRKETLETTVVAIKKADVIEASARGRLAELTIKFVSEIVNVTRDANNQVISGDPRDVQEITDFWTFLRDMRSNDPNWKLVATRTEN